MALFKKFLKKPVVQKKQVSIKSLVYTATGTVTAINETVYTKHQEPVRKITFKPDEGYIFYPSASGFNAYQIDFIEVGDRVEMEFEIRGSAGKFNNISIQSITKIRE